MEVICDKCNNEFIISKESILKKSINDIKVEYFKCLECEEVYIITCIDTYVERELRKLKALDEKIFNTINLNEKERLVIKAKKKLKHLKIQSDRLKREVKKIWNP